MDGNRIAGEKVFCHECAHDWRRDQGGLTCPDCHSEFTEIISTPPSPTASPTQRSPFSPSPDRYDHPTRLFDDHSPWEDDVPDPGEDDISEWTRTGRLGGSGVFTISARTIRRPAGRNHPVEDPGVAEVISDFETLLTNVMGGQPNARNRGFPEGPMMGMFTFPSEIGAPPGIALFPGGGRTTRVTRRVFPGDDGSEQLQTGNIHDILSIILSSMGNAQGPPGNAHPGGAIHSPLTLLSHLLNPANVQPGDAVFSQEQLDRVISQLMEQNAGSTAPPPASEAAIRSLQTRKVDESMMGNDGRAECSICMDDVEIGQEVTVLPCNHWFHGECVTSWLKEHDTCPHCRKSITRPPEEAQRSQSEQPPSNSRRSSRRRTSSITLPPSPGTEGSRRNPINVSESPRDIRAARQHHFEGRSGDYERQHRSRPSSYGEGRGNDNGGNGSRSSSGSNNGGVGGWFRNIMPSFQ